MAKFSLDHICCYLSLEKESTNFCFVFNFSIKRAREISQFHVVVMQQRQRYKTAWCKVVVCQYKQIIFLPFSLPLLSVLLSSRNSSTRVTWCHTSPLYCALMVGMAIVLFLIGFHWQYCSRGKHYKLSTILFANVANLAHFDTFIIILIQNITQVFCLFYLYIIWLKFLCV